MYFGTILAINIDYFPKNLSKVWPSEEKHSVATMKITNKMHYID